MIHTRAIALDVMRRENGSRKGIVAAHRFLTLPDQLYFKNNTDFRIRPGTPFRFSVLTPAMVEVWLISKVAAVHGHCLRCRTTIHSAFQIPGESGVGNGLAIDRPQSPSLLSCSQALRAFDIIV